MKILLLGHNGMLGSDLLQELGEKHDVVPMDVNEIDITSAQECKKAIAENVPEIVINATGYTNVDACESSREECFAVNSEALKNLAMVCGDYSIKIIHFSTDYVFDGMAIAPYKEDDNCNPLNVYGASKLAGERYLQELAKNYLLIRTAWLYGAKGKNFVRTILEKSKTVKRLEVVDDQVGSPTYTIDLAAAVSLLIDCNATGIFHITNRGFCSWYQFAVRILQEAGIADVEVAAIKSDKLPRPARRPAYSVMSSKKFTDLTGKILKPWQLALQDYLKRTNVGKIR